MDLDVFHFNQTCQTYDNLRTLKHVLVELVSARFQEASKQNLVELFSATCFLPHQLLQDSLIIWNLEGQPDTYYLADSTSSKLLGDSVIPRL